jgi:hypothetical protein
MLPDGDLTEIGEKGTHVPFSPRLIGSSADFLYACTLRNQPVGWPEAESAYCSSGYLSNLRLNRFLSLQVNIARALYFDADCILFDDPLSALDAHGLFRLVTLSVPLNRN